jgi:CheY-like chemotaxis protein
LASHADFKADTQGNIDTSKQAPISGSYKKISAQGWTAILAGNGRLACEAWEREFFDLILMDIQCLKWTGRRPRAGSARESGTAKSPEPIPVVALTAHASQAQHDQCLAAGMDAPSRTGELHRRGAR